jgi:predicted regulator of Ras-like GTPase activity (Roadblock/LC7/MglB family)
VTAMTTAQSIVLVASLVAAALFFLAGVLAARALLIPVLERERADAKTRERDLEARMKRAELELEGAVGEGDRLQQSLNEAQARLAAMRARAPAAQVPEPLPEIVAGDGDLGKRLGGILVHLSQIQGARGAVVADEHGLLVAGADDGGDGLAALAALFDEMAERVSRMTDFGELRRVTLRDCNSLAIAIQAIPIDRERLFLVSLSAGPGMEMEQLDAVIHEAMSPGSSTD